MRFALVAVLFLSVNSCAQWQMQDSHTKESLRGVSVVDANIVWASGTRGTYLLTSDGGKNWAAHQVPGAESLDFRGVKAFGSHAFLLAAGPGDKSRIYHTADLGKHWDLQFTNSEPKGFLDCMAFSDEQHGIVVGDPVKGKFQILRTQDGGKNWHSVDSQSMPPALDGEGHDRTACQASGAGAHTGDRHRDRACGGRRHFFYRHGTGCRLTPSVTTQKETTSWARNFFGRVQRCAAWSDCGRGLFTSGRSWSEPGIDRRRRQNVEAGCRPATEVFLSDWICWREPCDCCGGNRERSVGE